MTELFVVGGYSDNGSDFPACSRNDNSPSISDDGVGFRPALYLGHAES